MRSSSLQFHRSSPLAGALLLLTLAASQGQPVHVDAQTSGGCKIDLGCFKGSSVIAIDLSGQVSLGNQWSTRADGTLACPVTDGDYAYANPGSCCYPKSSGGDGINHFDGGGANFDAMSCSYGLAGAQTTDTTCPEAIRFGAVVGTFCATPQRSDWFYVGSSNVLTIPTNGAHLYLAVNDAWYANNTGGYTGMVKTLYPPVLTLTKTSESAVLSWPACGSNFVLETAAALAPPLCWTLVTNPPALIGDALTVTVDGPPACSLFRLRQQAPAP